MMMILYICNEYNGYNPGFSDTVLERGVNGYTDLLSTTGIGAFVGAIYGKQGRKSGNKQIVLDTIFISILHIIAAFVRVFTISMALMFMLGFQHYILNMSNAIIR